MTKAILVAFHKYTPYGGEFYEPIFEHFLKKLIEFQDEFDHVYFIDSTWNINAEKLLPLGTKASIFRVDSSLRYYDAYKQVLPQVTEDLVLFMDDDMIVWKKGVIAETFQKLEEGYDVVSIYDSIGTWRTDKMKGRNKFCPYWFATRKELLLKYLDVDWSPDSMPDFETLGKLTKVMIEDGLTPFEWLEDKSDISMEDSVILRRPLEAGKKGYYHIRSGSLPAVLLAWRENQPEEYWKYLREQPKREYLRQIMWYWYLGGDQQKIWGMLTDMGVQEEDWNRYYEQFLLYHAL